MDFLRMVESFLMSVMREPNSLKLSKSFKGAHLLFDIQFEMALRLATYILFWCY